jgi:hypothetical protein
LEVICETRFHRDVHLPAQLEDEARATLVKFAASFRLTKHARERMNEKQVSLPDVIPFMKAVIVEVTTRADRLQRFLLRFDAGDGRRDVCLSMDVEGRVPTVYLNRKNDRHKTLSREAYRKP